MTDNEMEHHKQSGYCKTRPEYRNSRHLTAVKVYSVINESRHLMVFGVPRINLLQETKQRFLKFGPIDTIAVVTDAVARQGLEIELFTDCIHVAFKRMENARKAKKFLDAKSFYGGVLHISYAPEYETVEDVRKKLQKRVVEVAFRLRINARNRVSQKRKSEVLDSETTKKSKNE